MTTLEQGASVTRKTKATIQHKALVVTLHAEFLELRRFGKRESLTATYESIYQAAAMRQAERDRRERLILQTEPNRERCAMTATSLLLLGLCLRAAVAQSNSRFGLSRLWAPDPYRMACKGGRSNLPEDSQETKRSAA